MKYNEKIVARICEMFANDSYTIAEVCRNVGLSEDCFYRWKKEKKEFRDAVARAQERFNETLIKEAKYSLRKRVNGYEFDENRTTYVNDRKGNPIIKERIKIRKHIQPDMSAIQFFLTNRDAQNWKNRQSSELTGKDGSDLFRMPVMVDDSGKPIQIIVEDDVSTEAEE